MSNSDLNKELEKEVSKAVDNAITQSDFSSLSSKLKEQFKDAGNEFSKTFSISSGLKKMISQTKEALTELKEVDTLLTQISKNNASLTKSQLEALSNNAFDIASTYGKTAADYLNAVIDSTNAGYKNAESMAQLSLAAQSAGDMTAALTNKYIIATDKAYNLGGSTEKLTKILDGSHNITAHNAFTMTELAESMTLVSNQAAQLGLDADETTAILATMLSTTQYSSSEIADAFEDIMYAIRQLNDEDNPMDIIKEFTEEYSKLSDSDLKSNLLASLNGTINTDVFNALLENYDMYEKMLEEYANGAGSMAKAAEQSANSWEASLNRLSNTWTETIGNVAESDTVITLLNCLNEVLSVINNITDRLDSLGTIGATVGLFAGIKNVGKGKRFPFNHYYMF